MKLNLPNKLTLLRIALVPVFMALAAFSHFGRDDFRPVLSFLAGTVFSAASITDLLDGYLARKNDLITDFGKIMDPLADKMLTTAALICMMSDGVCHPVVLALVLFREFAVAGVRTVSAARGNVIAANVWGKVKTCLQMGTIIFYYFAPVVFFFIPAWILLLMTKILCWAVAAVTLLSGVKYLWDNRGFLLS